MYLPSNFNLCKMCAHLPHCLYGAQNNEINAKIKISIGRVIITAKDYQLFICHRKVHSIPQTYPLLLRSSSRVT